jgi:hypothetical protein
MLYDRHLSLVLISSWRHQCSICHSEGLAHIMQDLFGGVVYAGIDTDKHKYPIGKVLFFAWNLQYVSNYDVLFNVWWPSLPLWFFTHFLTGSGRVTFNNHKSYMKAVCAGFIELKTPKFTKKVSRLTSQKSEKLSVFNNVLIIFVRFKLILIWKIRYAVLVTQTRGLISVVNCRALNTTVGRVGSGIILSKDYVITNPRLVPVKPRQARRSACLDSDSVCRWTKRQMYLAYSTILKRWVCEPGNTLLIIPNYMCISMNDQEISRKYHGANWVISSLLIAFACL